MAVYVALAFLYLLFVFLHNSNDWGQVRTVLSSCQQIQTQTRQPVDQPRKAYQPRNVWTRGIVFFLHCETESRRCFHNKPWPESVKTRYVRYGGVKIGGHWSPLTCYKVIYVQSEILRREREGRLAAEKENRKVVWEWPHSHYSTLPVEFQDEVGNVTFLSSYQMCSWIPRKNPSYCRISDTCVCAADTLRELQDAWTSQSHFLICFLIV